MSPELQRNLAGTGAALLAGGLTKWASKRRGKIVHKIASPIAAVLGGIGASMLQGEGVITFNQDVVMAGLTFGVQAVFGQSVVHGAKAQVSGKF